MCFSYSCVLEYAKARDILLEKQLPFQEAHPLRDRRLSLFIWSRFLNTPTHVRIPKKMAAFEALYDSTRRFQIKHEMADSGAVLTYLWSHNICALLHSIILTAYRSYPSNKSGKASSSIKKQQWRFFSRNVLHTPPSTQRFCSQLP